jgi:hypothetical protein
MDGLVSSVRTGLPIIRARAPVPFFVLAITLAGVRTVEAQGLGYGIAGPAGISGFFGSSASSIHAAAGGEGLFDGRAGIGGEVGVLANSGSALLVLSANGVLHFSTDPSRLSPFVTGGYTIMGVGYGEGSFSAWNVGAGVDYWAKDRVGVRIDFRDHVRPDSRGAVQYWTIRAGVVFR